MPQPTTIIIAYLLASAVAYLLGSVNFSIIITKKFMRTDVRKLGSGNAGATNMLRTAGKLPAIITFTGDFLKCVAAILISMLIANLFHINGEFAQYIKYTTGIFCMVGHIFPLYFGFKGGKGVTVAAAIMLMLDWRCFIIGIGIFILIVVFVRIVSLGSILACTSIVITTFVFQTMDHEIYAVTDTVLIAVIAAIAITKHRANIVRLFKGTEPRIQKKKK
jgi:acyl phosphate:glycerol-3-phosphate acyltransferase